MQKRWLNRPELGAPGGTIMVRLFFPIVAGERGFFTPMPQPIGQAPSTEFILNPETSG